MELQIQSLFCCHSVIKAELIPKKSGRPSGESNSPGKINAINFQDVSNQLSTPATVVPLLRPGSFVTLHNQPKDLPPFLLIQCRGGRCWVRQQAWGQFVHWEVDHERLRAA